MKIHNIIKKNVRGQNAYAIEERECAIKMDANENPYALSPALRKELFDTLSRIPLNRYPAAGSPSLRRLFAKKYHVHENMILIGNGSDELIQVLLTALVASSKRGVVVPVPTFAIYRIAALNTGHQVLEIPLDERFDLDLDAILNVIARRNPEVVFLSYPNNPTGNCYSDDRILPIIQASPGIVVVDEAYHNFSDRTFLPRLKEFKNLIILRTLSKVGFAALRIGVLIGHAEVVRELNKVRLPYNLNTLSQTAAEFFFSHEKEFIAQTKNIVSHREWLMKEMKAIRGILTYPSDSNFILFSCQDDKDGVYENLLQRGILIKNFGNLGPLRDCLRVTVGTESENAAFVEALKGILNR